jgi:hypothetical protein
MVNPVSVRSFWLGLACGAALGAVGMYLVLARPWQRDDAEVRAAVGSGAGGDQAGPEGQRDKGRLAKRRPGQATADAPVELSAADREAIWRGTKPELAAHEVDFGAAEDGRPLAADEINRTVSASADAIVACIETARGNAELEATITLEALVEPDGRVSDSRVRAPRYLHRQGLTTCMQKQARALQFPATGAQTLVTLPFDLR